MATRWASGTPSGAQGRRLLAVAAAVHFLIVALSLTGALNGLFFASSLPASRGDSFRSFYQAGVNLRAGVSPYTDPAQLDRSIERAHTVSGFRYTPPVALAFGALSGVFPPETLYWLWLALLEGVLWLCVLLTLRAREFGHRRHAAAAMWLLFTPFCVELHLGQISMLMAVGVLVLMLDAIGARPVGEGLWRRVLLPLAWAGTILIKAFTVLFAIPYLRAGKRGLVVSAGLMVLALTGVYFLAHPDDLRRYLGINGAPLVSAVFPGLMGFQGLIRSIADHAIPAVLRARSVEFGSFDVAVANLPGLAWIVLAVGLGLWGTWRLRGTDLFRGLGLWLAVFFLIYRQVWEYHYLMFLPVVACAYLATGARWTLVAWALMALPTPFAALTALGGPAEQSPIWILHHAVKPLAVAVTFAALLPWRAPAPALAPRAYRAGARTPAPAPVTAAAGVRDGHAIPTERFEPVAAPNGPVISARRSSEPRPSNR